jgi:alcohol dehydrogenase class IV
MAIASLFGGLALANARLGAVHGFAGPVGGMFPAPHGVVCARLLPFVAEANVKALRERGSRDSLARYDEVGRILTGQPDAAAEDGISWLQGLCETLNVPRLAESGVTESDFPALVASARKASSTRGNPIELTEQELTEILAEAV